MMMSLRGAYTATKQSPIPEGCFAKCARNDMQTARLASLWELLMVVILQTGTQEELSPSLRFGNCRCLARRSRDALLSSVLDRAFKGEL